MAVPASAWASEDVTLRSVQPSPIICTQLCTLQKRELISRRGNVKWLL